MIRLLLACFLITTLCAPLAHAQDIPPPTKAAAPNGPHNETPIPASLQGIWSSPDCTAGRQVIVISPSYALFLRQGLSRLGAVQSWRQEEDDGEMLYHYTTNNNGPALMKKSNDGLMKVMLINVHPQAPLKNSWGEMEDKTAREFAHCAKLFDSKTGLGQEEINTPFLLDTAFKACKGVNRDSFAQADACHQSLFNIADTDQNKTLNHAELARLYRQASFALAASIFCGGITYPADTLHESQIFADAVLGTEKSMTLTQIKMKLADTVFASGSGETFLENARNIQTLLPFLPTTAPGVTSCALAKKIDARNGGTIILPEQEQEQETAPPAIKRTGPSFKP